MRVEKPEDLLKVRKEVLNRWKKRIENAPFFIVGYGTCGIAAGADAVLKAVEEVAEGKEIMKVGCIGMCWAEPLLDVVHPSGIRVSYSKVTPSLARKIAQAALKGEIFEKNIVGYIDLRKEIFGGSGDEVDLPNLWDHDFYKKQVRIVLKNCGIIDPESIEDYIAVGGYSALCKAVCEMTPQQVIDEIKRSGLRGRGGAGFSTGLKWQFLKDAKGDVKYLICNADEGDPGAFMDRATIEGDPHAVIEGMIIGAYATGATKGYVYIRAEYPLAVKRLKKAIEDAKRYGFLGENILGKGFSFDIEIREGAGAFVCGEETALMASIEGKRGVPRPRPPYPAERGLWGKPTNINNVETFANVPRIISNGADWFASYGTQKSKGTKVFALAGKIKRTGLIEVPMGITLREIVFDIGGGIVKDKKFKAVQIGGPSGGCIPEELLDTPVDYESLTSAGAIMGSGGMIVMDEDTCMVDVAKYFLSFTQAESCGQCVPCREGTKRMLDILEAITAGRGKEEDLELLEWLAHNVRKASLCGLGKTAPNPVLSTLRYFRDEYMAHIRDKKCPAGVCKELTEYWIDEELCKACSICARNCPADAIRKEDGKYVIDVEKCVKCGTCAEVCPFGAVKKGVA